MTELESESRSNKVALVTGASKGIGLAISDSLAGDGYHVVMVARDAHRLSDAATLVRRNGGMVTTLACDVTDHQAVNLMVRSVVEQRGKIDVLVNNAGRGGGAATADMEPELWHSVIDTNLNSVYYVTKAVLHEGRMTEPGTIISIASTGGKQGVIYAAAYSASKHGVVGFTKSLALELALKGITVNAVCPGFVETDFAQRTREGYARAWNVNVAEAKERIEKRIPIGRYIQPEEVASMVSYLASPSARGITGQTFNVCGGLGNY